MSESKNPSRTPPPVLFLHPSPGASHVSIPDLPTQRIRAGQSVSAVRFDSSDIERQASVRSDARTTTSPQRDGRVAGVRNTDKTDALWAQMQATLEEVESTASGGTCVFGAGHERKLFELRSAQINLAQAWARSEAEEVAGATSQGEANDSLANAAHNIRSSMNAPTSYKRQGTERARTISRPLDDAPDGKYDSFAQLQADGREETEMDIVLGRKRREANDKYFQRVNDGVVHVVSKLEELAVAMHAVEKESQDIWNEKTAPDRTR